MFYEPNGLRGCGANIVRQILDGAGCVDYYRQTTLKDDRLVAWSVGVETQKTVILGLMVRSVSRKLSITDCQLQMSSMLTKINFLEPRNLHYPSRFEKHGRLGSRFNVHSCSRRWDGTMNSPHFTESSRSFTMFQILHKEMILSVANRVENRPAMHLLSVVSYTVRGENAQRVSALRRALHNV